METKINIAEILKDCLQGMELYSPIFGKVYLDKIIPHLAVRVTTDKKHGNFKEEFLYDGRYGMNGECMLFPSKDQRDWSKFQRPFKDGDIVTTVLGIHMFILQIAKNNTSGYCYIGYDFALDEFFSAGVWNFSRLATEEEKEKLFKAIKDNGYKWNAETKTLEKLVKPKFKVGDRIRHKSQRCNVCTIKRIQDNQYVLEEIWSPIHFNEQDQYELAPDKFDITTLVPFESRVLVRSTDDNIWRPAIYGFTASDKYYAVGGVFWKQCIPYEGNEHLLGTTNDCDDYYKTWE